MGRYKKRGRKKGGGGSKPNERREEQGEPTTTTKGKDYVKTIVEQGHFRMESYYAAQGLHDLHWRNTGNSKNDSIRNKDGELVACETSEEKEAERMRWRNSAISTLPAAFRIAKDVPSVLRDRIESELAAVLEEVKKADSEGGHEIVQRLSFLPQAYKLAMDRATIRKEPHLNKLHEWLKQQTHAGFITRQEIVSMVPPVVLAPKPDDKVLDMCAAPGSKTSQLLEDLGPRGLIVANDSNVQRAQ